MVTTVGVRPSQFSTIRSPPPFAADTVPAAVGLAALSRNWEFVMVSDCPGYCARNATPAPRGATLFRTTTESRARLLVEKMAPPELSRSRRAFCSVRPEIDTR